MQACASLVEPTNPSSHLVCHDAQRYANQVVGDGHCVSLIKQCSKAPDTRFWKPGRTVLDQAQLPSGTIIATFKNGRYPNRSGYHAAIYIRHDSNGIWVWDQWLGKAVHQRYIRVRSDGATANNTAQAYKTVRVD